MSKEHTPSKILTPVLELEAGHGIDVVYFHGESPDQLTDVIVKDKRYDIVFSTPYDKMYRSGRQVLIHSFSGIFMGGQRVKETNQITFEFKNPIVHYSYSDDPDTILARQGDDFRSFYISNLDTISSITEITAVHATSLAAPMTPESGIKTYETV